MALTRRAMVRAMRGDARPRYRGRLGSTLGTWPRFVNLRDGASRARQISHTQKGLTMTMMTIMNIRIVGTSLAMR